MERAVASRGRAAALAHAAGLARPVTLAREHVLPVSPALSGLFPAGGLRRGSAVVTRGDAATSLALALAAAPSSAGSWVAALGLPSLGLLAAAEAGVALERLILVAEPPARTWATVAATLVDGVDVVLLSPPRSLRPGEARRLQARARERGSVLLVLGAPATLEPEVTLTARVLGWEGLEEGAGHLRARRVAVHAVGRGAYARPRTAGVWLPDHEGRIRAEDTAGDVVPLRQSG